MKNQNPAAHDGVIDMVPRTREILTADEYLVVARQSAEEIRSVRFVLPRIGSNSFGSFEVEFKRPRFVMADFDA